MEVLSVEDWLSAELVPKQALPFIEPLQISSYSLRNRLLEAQFAEFPLSTLLIR